MKEWLKNLLAEQSSVSSMRVMSLSCVFVAAMVALVALYQDHKDLSGVAILVGAFLVPAFGGKVAQKNFESKEESQLPKP